MKTTTSSSSSSSANNDMAPKRFYGPSMKQSGALTSALPAGSSRGSKTLGWFMTDTDLFDKKKQNSLDETNEKNRLIPNSVAIGEERKKQKRLRKTMSCQGTARKESYATSQAMSESSEEGYEEKKLNNVLDFTIPAKQSSLGSTVRGGDEYWFYDVASDGYYYEQNGAKGWRRRMPNVSMQKQDVGNVNFNGQLKYNNTLTAQAAHAALLHHAILQQQQNQQQQQQQPTMRYYDPNSDGFYYEMASVDGWKRRQPNKPVSASVPAGITRPYAVRQAEQQVHNGLVMPNLNQAPSYGSALARGLMPRNCVIDESSASSSISGDNVFQDLFGVGQEQAYSSISRPNDLNLENREHQINPNFNADKFIRDLSGIGNNKIFGMGAPTSNNSWNSFRSCSLWNPSPVKSTTAQEDEANLHHLLKDLDKIWAAPTPASGVNQA